MRLTAIFGGIFICCVGIYLHCERERKSPLKSFSEWQRCSVRDTPLIGSHPLNSLGDSEDGVFWFIQVSDIHINQDGRGAGLEHFEYFLKETVPLVDPLFVTATGDLTDAKNSPSLGSRQHIKEWEIYRQLLKDYGYYERENFWFDIRGNHDCFDVPGWHSEQNLFSKYSKMKSSTYSQVFTLPFGKYGLIAIDGCPNYGPSRPFNFFGTLTTAKMSILEKQIDDMMRAEVKHIFMISHYPIVTMQFELSKTGKNFYDLSRDVSVYLSGHLHRIVGGLGRELYAKHANGLMDIEVNDLKDSRVFRIGAIDHDIFSFGDFQIDMDPFILITNPPDARFLMHQKLNMSMIRDSTHIRVLIFSKSPLNSSWVKIDDGPDIPLLRVKSSSKVPLYVARWNPSVLGKGLHVIKVEIVLSDSSIHSAQRTFSVDGTDAKIGSFGEWCLHWRLELFIKSLFWGSFFFLYAVMLIVPGIFTWYKKQSGTWCFWREVWIARFQKPPRTDLYLPYKILHYMRLTFFKMFVRACFVAEKRWIFIPFFMFASYVPVGPLLIAPLSPVDSRYSLLFSWGLWVRDFGWIRSLDTWTFASFLMAFQLLPAYMFISIYSTGMDLYDSSSCTPTHKRWWFKSSLLTWWIVCTIKNLVMVRTFGILSLILGFGSTWTYIVSTLLILWTINYSQPSSSFRKLKIEDD